MEEKIREKVKRVKKIGEFKKKHQNFQKRWSMLAVADPKLGHGRGGLRFFCNIFLNRET